MTFADLSSLVLASPPAQVSPNALTQIPFPANQLPQRAVVAEYPFAVLVNSSPFALLVTQSGVITQIAAYTQDLLELPIADGSAPITVLAMPGLADIAFGVDQSVYVTWYPTKPDGEYPAAIGAGTIPIGTNTILVGNTFDGTSPFGTLDVTPTPTWVQTIAICTQTIPPAGAYVIVTYDDTGQFICATTLSNAQIFYVPVNGRDTTITLLGDGANIAGTWAVYGIAAGITAPRIQPFGGGNSGGVSHGPQPAVLQTILAGATNTLIAAPPFGMQLRLRAWSFTFAAAPAAGAVMDLRGLSTGNPTLLRRTSAGVVNDPGSPVTCDVWVPDFLNASSHNQPDGVQGRNLSTQSAVFHVDYELWPTQLSPV